MEVATQNESVEAPLKNAGDVELQAAVHTPANPSLPMVEIPLPPPPPADSTPLHPTIRTILKDNIVGTLLKYQLPTSIVAIIFALISAKSGHYESTGIIMLLLLVLVVLAFIAGRVLRDERPVIAAVAELVGISVSVAAFIYPMSVLLRGSILCYVPPIFGLVVAVIYIYRLATASSGDTDESQV